MHTHSGHLRFGKREEKAMRCALMHCKIDMSYGGGGTFSKGDNENTEDEKEVALAKKGVELFEWILETYKL